MVGSRDAFAQMRSAMLAIYVTASAITAAVALVALYERGDAVLQRPMITATFCALLLIGEIMPLRWLRLNKDGEITISWAFAFALLLVESPFFAVAAMALASLIADYVHGKPPSRVLFNAAQLSLSIGAAGFVLEATGQRGVLIDPTRSINVGWIATVLLAGLTLLVVNGLLILGALILAGGDSLGQTMRDGLTANSRTDGALLALAPALVVVSERSVLLLPMALVTAIVIHRSARRALDREHEATHDSLTDLFNRRAFIERLDAAIDGGQRKGRVRALFILDLDGFKSINDMLGHHVGDEILREVGRRLTALHGPGQVSARLGGDEFATLIVHLGSNDEAMVWARQLHDALAQPYITFGFPVQLTASIGVAMLTDDTDSSAAVLRAADIAMYSAKREALGVQLQNPHETSEISRLSLIAELSGAIERGELYLEYQPQAHTATGHVFGFEALLRWQHPKLGLIMPSEFMPLAEQTELMQPVTRFVLSQSLAELTRWRAQGWDVRVAINVSAQNLHSSRFPGLVAELLQEMRLPGNVLELEITENAVMSKRDVIRNSLNQLRALGTRIVIDDFGTGYSSLANMRHLPLDGVKIDCSFITDLDNNHDDLVIVSSIIELAHNLNLECTAEGVESAASWQRLAQLGCDHIQGYLISRPMTADRVYGWLRRYTADRAIEVRDERPRLQLVTQA
jgi:diguanylate cyclase